MKRLLSTLLIAGLIAAPGFAKGSPEWEEGKHFNGEQMMHHWQQLEKDLNLDANQVKKFGDINLKYKKRFLEYAEKISPVKIKIKRLTLEESINYTEIRNLMEKIHPALIDMEIDRIKQKQELRDILTDEQKAKFDSLKPGPGNNRRGKGMRGKNREGRGFMGKFRR